MRRVISQIGLATENPGKLKEFQHLVGALGVDVFQGPRLDYPPETGADYLANAIGKATFAAQKWGVCCVGEDSGIEISGLANLPGVYSARFSRFDRETIAKGIAQRTLVGLPATLPPPIDATDFLNNSLVLDCLFGKQGNERLARYVACIVLVSPAGELLYANHACVDGRILEAPRGPDGFGYDPIMELFDYPGRSVAELTMDEKSAVSHRARAFTNFASWLMFSNRL